jgi:hypothetical protein
MILSSKIIEPAQNQKAYGEDKLFDYRLQEFLKNF